MRNIDTARRYLDILADRAATPEQLDALLAPDIVMHELPNTLVPSGQKRDRQALLNGFALGRTLLASEQYTVLNALESGDTVVLEVAWHAILAQGFGKFPAGTQMRAQFAIFLEFRDGKIAIQRNYDCYEPIQTRDH